MDKKDIIKRLDWLRHAQQVNEMHLLFLSHVALKTHDKALLRQLAQVVIDSALASDTTQDTAIDEFQRLVDTLLA